MELPSDNEKDTGVSHNAATDVVAGEIHDVDPAWAKKVVRKIDKRIVLCCMMTFTMNFIDKILLGQSAIFGIRESTASLLAKPPHAGMKTANHGNRV